MKIYDTIVDFMMQNEIVSQEDAELYKFGIEQGVIFLINIITMLLIGIGMNNFFSCIVMSFTYMNIRRYAGGYHAKDIKVCFVLSSLLIILGLFYVKLLSYWVGFKVVTILFSTVMIMGLAPYQNTNNPLDQAQIIRYKSKTRKRFCSALIIALILEFIGMNNMTATVVTALFLISVMLAVGAIIEKVCV